MNLSTGSNISSLSASLNLRHMDFKAATQDRTHEVWLVPSDDCCLRITCAKEDRHTGASTKILHIINSRYKLNRQA